MHNDLVFLSLAGTRLQLLKEQLQAEMKVKRAETRKIQESQRKLDNEEISEEEEEEEITDDEGMSWFSVFLHAYMCTLLQPCGGGAFLLKMGGDKMKLFY